MITTQKMRKYIKEIKEFERQRFKRFNMKYINFELRIN